MAGDGSFAPLSLAELALHKHFLCPLPHCRLSGCWGQVSDLFPTSQVKDQRDDGFFAPGSLQQGMAMRHLTGFLWSPRGPKLLGCVWRRLNSPSPAVRGRPFPGRGAALVPPAAVSVLLQFRIPAEVWLPGGSHPRPALQSGS